MGTSLQRIWAAGADLPTQRRDTPPFSDGEIGQIVELVTGGTPADHQLCGHRWTTRKVMLCVGQSMARRCGRTLVWILLRAAHLSWKKPKKILAKANTAKRLEYLQRFEQLYEEMKRGERTLIYIDEAHLHQDMDSGCGWYFKGRRWLVPSTTPGLHAKINWYGAYNFTDGKAMI
jgi:transposase